LVEVDEVVRRKLNMDAEGAEVTQKTQKRQEKFKKIS
jgi:hypothetical protein